MKNSLDIKFITNSEFTQLQGKNLATELRLNILSPGSEVSESNQTIIQQGTNTSEIASTSASSIADSNIGILIANGNNLHSHMSFNFCALSKESSINTVAEFSQKINEFFEYIDNLIRQGYFRDQTITLDHIHLGGLAEILSCSIDTRPRIETNAQLKEALEKIVETRLAQTQKLADENGVKIDYSKSIFWGQRLFYKEQSPSGATLAPSTNMHYDPQSHTLSINAGKIQ